MNPTKTIIWPARIVCAIAGLLLTVTACGDSDADDADGTGGGGGGVSGDVVVFAASSLTEAFTQIADDFGEANPDATVTFNFAASSALAAQIASGAPADVFASASTTTMAKVTDAGDAAAEPIVFVRNRLEIAVPADNPGDVTGLADFADTDLTIALCDEQVPCGAAAVTAFEAAGITPEPDTLEQDVKAALSKVELGEVDAALVYRTDVIASGDKVKGIEFPEAEQAINDYPIVVLKAAPNTEGAQAFLDYVRSEDGQQVLADAGFESP